MQSTATLVSQRSCCRM